MSSIFCYLKLRLRSKCIEMNFLLVLTMLTFVVWRLHVCLWIKLPKILPRLKNHSVIACTCRRDSSCRSRKKNKNKKSCVKKSCDVRAKSRIYFYTLSVSVRLIKQIWYFQALHVVCTCPVSVTSYNNVAVWPCITPLEMMPPWTELVLVIVYSSSVRRTPQSLARHPSSTDMWMLSAHVYSLVRDSSWSWSSIGISNIDLAFNYKKCLK